jgi:transcriptional regulator with XRE-family HTH domain
MVRHKKRAPGADTRQPADVHKTQAKLARHLGTTARAARTAAKLTQADVAERVGVATEVYGRLERGGMLPSVPTLRKLCSALRADANALLGLNSGVPLVSVNEPTPETEEESPRVRQVLRVLRRLTPSQLNAVGHVASTFIKSNEHPSDTRAAPDTEAPSGENEQGASPQGQNA